MKNRIWLSTACQGLVLANLIGVKTAVAQTTSPQLHQAIEAHDVEMVSALLSGGADPNQRDELGNTALHLAASFGDTTVVSLLLERGAAIDLAARGGVTALHYAVNVGNLPVVRFLLATGANVNPETDSGNSPLDIAVRDGYPAIAYLLSQALGSGMTREVIKALQTRLELMGYEPGVVDGVVGSGTTVAMAAFYTDMGLEHSSDISEETLVQIELANRPLFTSRLVPLSSNIFLTFTELTVRYGWKPTRIALDGNSDVHAISATSFGGAANGAACSGGPNMISPGTAVALAPAGGSFSIAGHFRMQSIEIDGCVVRSYSGIFFSRGVKLTFTNAPDRELSPAEIERMQRTASEGMQAAVEARNSAEVQTLLNRGADVNVRGTLGRTPLHIAAMRGYPQIASILIANGAAINITEETGRTPLHLAVATERTDTALLLIHGGAMIDVRNNSGQTVLHLAALYGDTSVLEALLERDADTTIRDNSGATPLDLATAAGRTEATAILTRR